MAILPPSVDYTDKDFDALRARLIALVRSVFPDWSDFSVATFGNVLLEMYAFVGDVVTFYLDAQARESRLVTATQRKNVIALARMLGYRLHGARAATAEVEFTVARTPTADVTIPAGAPEPGVGGANGHMARRNRSSPILACYGPEPMTRWRPNVQVRRPCLSLGSPETRSPATSGWRRTPSTAGSRVAGFQLIAWDVSGSSRCLKSTSGCAPAEQMHPEAPRRRGAHERRTVDTAYWEPRP